jgi:hypothetical protein
MTGAELIAAERQRQIEQEGWTPEHDAKEHDDGSLAEVASSLASPHHGSHPMSWQVGIWNLVRKRNKWSRIEQLTVAGALIAAEIDRLTQPAPTIPTAKAPTP